MPATTTSTVGTGGDYATWALWEAATDNDLVTLDQIQVGNQVNESLSTPSITMAGAVTDTTRYREMRGQGFDGIGGGAVLSMGAGVLTITESNFRCTTLRIEFAGGGTTGINIYTGTGILIDRCIIYDTNMATGRTYMILLDNPGGATIRRCVIIGFNRSVAAVAAGITWKVQNCTIIGRSNTASSSIPYQGAVNITATGTLENCIVSGFHDRDISTGWTTIRNNISRDATSTGAGALTSKIEGDIRFRNLVLYDYSVRSGSVVAGAGADLSADFTTDITGRTITAPYPIGAHLPVAAPTFVGAASATNNQDGSISVAWAAATAQGAVVRGYKVHVHTSAMVDADLDADTYLLAEIPAGDTNVDVWTTADGVTALTSGTTYYFAVRAVSMEDDEDQNTTNQSVAPSLTAPTFGALTSATNNADGSAVLAWSAATFGTTVPTDARRYKIHVHTATMTDANLDADTYLLCSVDSAQTSFDVFTLSDGITALTSGTTYYFAVRAFQRVAQLTSEDQNTTNRSVAVTSGVTAPTAAINGHINSIANTSFTAVLDAFPSTNIDRWRMGYRIKNDTAANTWTYSSANTTVAANQTIAVSGLTASNIYEVFFQGGNGASTWGDPGEISMIFTSSTSNTWDGTQITNQIMTLIDDNLTSGLSLSRVTQYGSLADYPQDRDLSAQLPLCMVELQNVSYNWARFPKGYDIIYSYRILYAKEFAWTAAVTQDRVDSLGRLVALFADFRQLGLNGGSTTEGQVASVLVTEASPRPEEDQLKPHDRIFVVGLTVEVTARAQA